MARTAFALSLVGVAMLARVTNAGAATADPDWPCVQRKVPQLSLGQVWNGPDLPPSAKEWSSDASVSALVEDVAARRLPLGDAQKKIRDFAASLPVEQLAVLLRGVDHRHARLVELEMTLDERQRAPADRSEADHHDRTGDFAVDRPGRLRHFPKTPSYATETPIRALNHNSLSQ